MIQQQNGDSRAAGAERKDRPRRGQGREALLAAVARVVAREGIDGVTLRSVAAEAGVTHGLATYHFPSRDAMLEEAMTWAVQEGIDNMGITSADGLSLMSYAVDFVAERSEEMTFQFEVIFHGQRSPEVLTHVRRLYEAYFDAVQEALRRSGLPSDRRTAKMALAMMDGLAVQQLMFGDEGDARATGELFTALLAALPRPGGDRGSPPPTEVVD